MTEIEKKAVRLHGKMWDAIAASFTGPSDEHSAAEAEIAAYAHTKPEDWHYVFGAQMSFLCDIWAEGDCKGCPLEDCVGEGTLYQQWFSSPRREAAKLIADGGRRSLE